MKPVRIVGAGFSGLTLAHELVELGIPVQIFEKRNVTGGLISSRETSFGVVESAANAILANAEIEHLFQDLKVEFAENKPERKNRYIFWERPRRWPLTFASSLKLFKLLFTRFGFFLPETQETVRHWARRVVGAEFESRLLAPALGGVYAGDVKELSASLVLKKMLSKSDTPKGVLRGSVSPKAGMGELIEALTRDLKARGVEFEMDSEFVLEPFVSNPTVLCTSAWGAEKILMPNYGELADALKKCESLPLISVTAFFEPKASDLQGFGCLFPEEQKFSALGVLFNANIFSNRSEKRSETWIFGGARERTITQLSDAQLRARLFEDRKKLTGQTQDPIDIHITRWPKALPHYTIAWESVLKELKTPPFLYLHGNYLGQLGLSQIYSRSRKLAKEIKANYGT